jgi:regulatory protein
MDLYQAALSYVARYATSKENLRRVLWRKHQRYSARIGEPVIASDDLQAEIENVIERLEGLGVLDDVSYAASQAKTLRARGSSGRAIRAKLGAKGLDRETIDAAAAEQMGDEQELTAARRYAKRRRLGSYRERPPGPDAWRRDLAALCRAGFSPQVAMQVLGNRED